MLRKNTPVKELEEMILGKFDNLPKVILEDIKVGFEKIDDFNKYIAFLDKVESEYLKLADAEKINELKANISYLKKMISDLNLAIKESKEESEINLLKVEAELMSMTNEEKKELIVEAYNSRLEELDALEKELRDKMDRLYFERRLIKSMLEGIEKVKP